MIIIGHRAARDTRPENTIAALEEGSRWADYVEIDVLIGQRGILSIRQSESLLHISIHSL